MARAVITDRVARDGNWRPIIAVHAEIENAIRDLEVRVSD